MKILIIVPAIIISFGCNRSLNKAEPESREQVTSASVHKPVFVLKNNFDEISLSNPQNGFERRHGQYEIYVTIKNISAKNLKDYFIDGYFYDRDGKLVGKSDRPVVADVGPGDSTRMKLPLLFPLRKSLPWKVVIKTSKY